MNNIVVVVIIIFILVDTFWDLWICTLILFCFFAKRSQMFALNFESLFHQLFNQLNRSYNINETFKVSSAVKDFDV